MKVLILGGSGYLGSKLMEKWKNRHDVLGTYFNNEHEGLVELDIRDKDRLVRTTVGFKPDIIVNTSAFSSVDFCEDHPKKALDLNTKAVRTLSDLCEYDGIKLIHISSGSIFKGDVGNYSENDLPDPINTYGLTKGLADRHLIEKNDNYIIARVSLLYGHKDPEGKKFADWILNNLRNGTELDLAVDTFCSPGVTEDVASALETLIDKGRTGIYNIAGPEIISKYDFAIKIAQIYGLNEKLIKPIKQADLRGLAPRAADVSLNINKLTLEGIKMRNIYEGINFMKDCGV